MFQVYDLQENNDLLVSLVANPDLEVREGGERRCFAFPAGFSFFPLLFLPQIRRAPPLDPPSMGDVKMFFSSSVIHGYQTF